MSALTPAVQAALADGQRPFIAGLIRMDLPGYTLRLADGGHVRWGSEDFVGRDPRFGVIASIGGFEDGVGDQAPALSLELFPGTTVAATDLSRPDMQGSRVRMWLAVIDPSTGAPIPDPYLIFSGEVDQTVLTAGRGDRRVRFELVSGFERFFENEEGTRLSDAFHQSIWPGETGLANVTGVQKRVYWGAEAPPPSARGYGGAFGGIGGGWSIDSRGAQLL